MCLSTSVLIDQNRRDSTKDKLRRKIFFFSDKVCFFLQEYKRKKRFPVLRTLSMQQMAYTKCLDFLYMFGTSSFFI